MSNPTDTTTATTDAIRRAVDRARTAMTRMDSVGRGTARTRARIEEGLTCRVEDGRWSFTVDMPEKAGGGAHGPDPGVFGRTGLASCLAVGYAMWAAHEGVPVASVEVEVEADYDARPEYGLGEKPPGYDALRWTVRIESSAPDEAIDRVLAITEERSPWLALIRDPRELHRTVELRRPEGG